MAICMGTNIVPINSMQFMNTRLSNLVYYLRFMNNFDYTSKYFGENTDLTVEKIVCLY